jgi:protein SCO1/2
MIRLCFWLFFCACGSESGDRYALTGVVLDVGPDSVVVDHQEIPGFMQAMVMRLKAEKSGLKGLKRGDEITATLLVNPGTSQLMNLKVIGFESLPDLNGEPHGLVIGDPFPATTLQIGEKEVVQLGPHQSGVKILTFLFTTCPFPEACPLLATKLKQLQPLLLGQGQIIALTLDPETDSFPVLNAYGDRFGADPKLWRFARAPLAKLEGLFDQLEMMRYKRDGAILHSLKLLVIDASGTIVRFEQNNDWNPEEIAQVVRKAHAKTLTE